MAKLRFKVKPKLVVADQPVAPTVSTATFNIDDGFVNGQAVGTPSLSNNPNPSTVTWSITAGNDDGAFAINSSTGQITVADATKLDNGTTPSYSLTVQASNGVSPDGTATITVNVAAAGEDTFIGIVTVENASDDAKTDEIVKTGLVFAAGDIKSGEVLRVFDDDGSGGIGSALDNFQVEFESTDLDGETRVGFLAGILPSLPANGNSGANRKLRLYSSSTAQPSGTAITASDILDTAFETKVTYDIGGTEHVFSARDALAAEDTFSKTDYRCTVVASGPCFTRFKLTGPPKNDGTAHASGDGLRTNIYLDAFKAGTGAVDSENPITLIEAKVGTDNGDTERASPANLYYGLKIERSTSLSDSTLISTDDTDPDGNIIRYVWARSTPDATITLSAATAGTGRKITLSSGSFPTDIIGARIASSDGVAVVTARDSDTVVTAYIYDPFGSTTYTSGNWSIEGIGHRYNCRMPPIPLWVGNKPTNIVAWGEHDSAITPTTKGVMDFAIRSKLLPNFGKTFADVSHTTGITALNLLCNSDGSRRPFTFRGPAGGGNLGQLVTDIGGVGQTAGPNVGPIPLYCLDGLIKFDADGRRRIFEHAEIWSTWQYNVPARYSGSPTNGQLGVHPRSDNGSDYSYRSSWSGSFIKGVVDTAPTGLGGSSAWPFTGDTAHHSCALYVAYLLTGDLYYLECLQRQAEYGTGVGINPGFNGSGANRTTFGDASLSNTTNVMGNHQTRGKAWTFRDFLMATICTWDDAPASIVNDKTYMLARLAKHWTAAKGYGPDDVAGVRSGDDESPQWWYQNGNAITATGMSVPRGEAQYQLSFGAIVLGMAKEMGLMNADGEAFYEWHMKWFRDVTSTTSEIVRDIMSNPYWIYLIDQSVFTTQPTSMEDVYQRSCLVGPLSTSELGPFIRTPTGTATLSDNTVGTGRTFVFSNDYFSGGGEWYVGGRVRHMSGGIFVITAVSMDGLTLTGNVTVAFGSSGSQTISSIRIPGPHPDDYGGENESVASSAYPQLFTAGCRMAIDNEVAVASDLEAAVTYMTGRTGYAESDQWDIQQRTA